MPKVTVVPEDKLIIVDGEPIVFDSPFPAPSSLHALQWNGVGGHIEWKDDDNWPLETEAYEEEVAPYVTLWQAEKNRRDEAAAKADEEYHSLANTKKRKLSEINAAYESAIAALTATYPASERESFYKQEAEALAWTADPEAKTPFVDALATGRQMDKAELMQRIIAKAVLFSPASGYLTGQRQRYEDMLEDAETLEEVAAIVPEYTMPEGV